MLTVGLIGCGGMGAMHANCYIALADRVKLVAIADTMPEKAEKFAKVTGAKVYTSGEELLKNEKPDIIDVCVPTYLHTKFAVEAMEMGCHVFCEKPICLNEDEAKLLLETEKKTGMKFQVGQVLRFIKEYKWTKEMVEKGTYGRVLAGHFARLSSNPFWGWENWFNDPEKSGTAALDLHIHDVDFVRYIMGGNPDSVYAKGARDEKGVLMHIMATYTFGDATITTEGGWDFPKGYPFNPLFRLKLEKATIMMSREHGLQVYTEEGECFTPELKDEYEAEVDIGINVSSLGGYYSELRYFIDEIIKGDGKAIAPLSEGIESARLVWKEVESAGGRVRK